MTFITRAQWGARPPKSTGNSIGAHPLGVVIHYSAANLGSSPESECDDKVRGIQRYHQDTKDWADIAYTSIVCPHGNEYEGRGTGKGSAANGTTKANLDYYAVCALGGPKDTPSALMLTGIGTAIARCRKAGAGSKVLGHSDLLPTGCPGAALYAYVKAGHWNRIINRVVAAVSRVLTRKPVRVRLVVNGVFDTATRKRLQQWAGVTQDGDLGPISWAAIQKRVGSTKPYIWHGLQRVVGAPIDNIPGPVTYRALQVYLNSH